MYPTISHTALWPTDEREADGWIEPYCCDESNPFLHLSIEQIFFTGSSAFTTLLFGFVQEER
jgi:hypothetical protein